MNVLFRAIPLILTIGLLPAAGAQAVDMKMPEMKMPAMLKKAEIAPQIDAANKAWLAAYAKGDAAALAALYTDDATVLPAGADMVTGHDAIQKFWAATIASGLKITGLTTVAIDQHGAVAREIGRVTAETVGPDKTPVKMDGKYVVYWKEAKGVWKLDTDIWNMNK
jgi:uncharacterized protein (TIGR02246 family)